MGYNDEQEKIKQAEDWIMGEPVGSEHWNAAWDHIRYLLGMEPRFPYGVPDITIKAQAVANKGILAERYIDHEL